MSIHPITTEMTKLLVAAVLLTAALPCHSFDGRAGYLVPEIGSWFGVAESWNTSVASYISLLGVEPVAYTYYINFPFSPSDRTYLDNFVNEVGARKGIIVLTVEPYQGLATVTDAAIQDLVASIAQWEKNGVIFIVRFAHEMNGSW